MSQAAETLPESFWRSLRHLNLYRLFLTFALMLGAWAFPQAPLVSEESARLFLAISVAYGACALALAGATHVGRFAFASQLHAQVAVDVLALTLLMALSGGNASGLGLLLIVPLAASGMLPSLRGVIVVGVLATLAVLAEQSFHAVWSREGLEGFMRAGMLSVGFFTVALLSHALAKGTQVASRLAGEKTELAEHLARINDRVIHELPFGVLAIDAAGQVLLANSRAEAVLQGRCVGACELGRCSPLLAELWSEWRDTGRERASPFQVQRDGPRLRARFIGLGPDRAAGAMVVLEDMTELEAEAQKMKLAALGRLTANLAHEIRNPLSAINHAAQLLREEEGNNIQARLCRIIEDNAQRLNWLVDDVLTLNRRDRVNRESLDLPVVLAAFAEEFERNQGVPAGILRLEVAAGASVCFDRMHLQQILWNLCRNGWHYCRKEPGSIRLAVHGVGEEVDIDVFNDGPCIVVAMQEHLFEPFYTTDRKGTGLGLYISRELAEANQARLRYVDNPDGALFRLSCQAAPC